MSSRNAALPPTTEKPQLVEEVLGDLKRREEAKRSAATDLAARWQAVQQFMAWAASQSTTPKMTPAACKAKERRLLAGMAGMFVERAAEE